MSDFYSRCLSCGVDLPRGCRFCGEVCRDRWYAKHPDATPVARVMTDEWPLVERESEAKDAVSAGNRQDASPGADEKKGEGIISPTARTLYYDHKRLMPF